MDNRIQNYNVNQTFGAKKMEEKQPKNFQEQVDMTIKKLSERSEREVPEYGDFAPVVEMFDNLSPNTSDIAGKYALAIIRLPKDVEPDPKQRYIEAAAYEPTGTYKAKMVVGSGKKDEVLKMLKDPEFAKELCYTYGDLVESLKDM